ncbi:hypothetical protein VNI00_013053 [Paramarasmius palmivorus]|uniref:Uncharacterized protein n=1 Tax=Paramarasmius palmivorus TaxID=297713 RepID=A0AAW0C0I0_9AGAR
MAGRIWWITRQARQLMGQRINSKYRTIIAIILESGSIYPTSIIVYLIIANTLYYTNTAGILPIDLYPVVWQAAGIAPTLIIVRAGSGKSVETVDQVVSTLHFADAPQRVTVSMEASESDKEQFGDTKQDKVDIV